MNKKQSNKLNSYQSVKGVLEDNEKIYTSVPIIQQTVVSFFSIIHELTQIATNTEMDTTGETSAKIVAKDKLATLASSLAASGAVYAFDISDIELEASLGYTFSDLRYARDSETLQISKAIEVELLENQVEVVNYMVTEENMAELHQLIDDFSNAMETKGGVKSESVAETRRLAVLFRGADDLLSKKLDRFIVRLKAMYPTFYDAYKNARMIIDL